MDALHRGAYEAYLAADLPQRAQIGRAVATSFGGLRVAVDGRLIVGPSDHIWQRGKQKRELAGLGHSRRHGPSAVSMYPSIPEAPKLIAEICPPQRRATLGRPPLIPSVRSMGQQALSKTTAEP
jgi:hypothetical protein